MHRIAATPGGWSPDAEGVIIIEQTPAPIVLLTAADTDIQVLAASLPYLGDRIPEIRAVNLLNVVQQLSIDSYAESVLQYARVIAIRLLGGRSYWDYGLEVVKQLAGDRNIALIIMPGESDPDPELMSHSTVPLHVVNQFWRYWSEGGITNISNSWLWLNDLLLNPAQPDWVLTPPEVVPIPKVGYLHPTMELSQSSDKVGILFYRAHYCAGNTAPIELLCQALRDRGLTPVAIFVSSLRDRECQQELLQLLQPPDGEAVRVLLNTTSFAISSLQNPSTTPNFFHALDVPTIQVILSSSTLEQWETGTRGLLPKDVAMNIALPEVDGRIISRAISFKAAQTYHRQLETDVVGYQPLQDRIDFVADLAQNWVKLGQKPVRERKVALILANYPTRDGRLANGVGLDTPASCVNILHALQQAGYQLQEIPETGEELIARLTAGITNDEEGRALRSVMQYLSYSDYEKAWEKLPPEVQTGISQRWNSVYKDLSGDRPKDGFPISGLNLGHVFVGIQPSRGYDLDPALNYHAPDLEPTPDYLAFYQWIAQIFQADAIVHVGKHGNLEWLPGKSLALSQSCYPEAICGAMPHLYPFIVNDPGEGSQAKRRSQAVILDHLTPPMTRAELYGPLQQLEALVDEYYEADSLDPSRLPIIGDRIRKLIRQQHLDRDLQLTDEDLNAIATKSISPLLTNIDGYLCELKEAQIRDGLHIFGHCPENEQLRDLIIAISRSRPNGITRALAEDLGLEFDPLTADPREAIDPPITIRDKLCDRVGDIVEQLENLAIDYIDSILTERDRPHLTKTSQTQTELTWIETTLLPQLRATSNEITNLLRGLDGRYIASGPSGAPTRGRAEVLPTGRNFYSVDIRAIPTETAWGMGRQAAEVLIERYTQENGEYPKTVGLSMWGTSAMRTGGEDLAEALWLLGVQPVWDGPSRRVVDFEIIPVSVLGRPRVDVTLRISGFFRDGFPNLIDLFNRAVQAVASLEEPEAENPLAAAAARETVRWQEEGLSAEQAMERSRYRMFGSKPGAYGAGLQGLIEAQNWRSDEDLARAYLNWSSYAYTANGEGRGAPEVFAQRLRDLQIVLHNQDNREHDLLDSDDYYQFQGGLTVAVRSLTGKNPTVYFGDNSVMNRPKVRKLEEEINRVYRSRVVNPKWIAGAMRHGYKGAFEMAATIDYLFAYDATTRCVPDHMYEGVSDAYLLDPKVREFIESSNPWALRDMAERLLEAHQRGLWQDVSLERIDELRAIAHQAEAKIEGVI
ncbi:cobaltochelatase subunit CobN [Roseofilum casamattae]|uniref:Cobaltochelatase subunit CobN n=1 Tax=Roseofilum casamattae BLCC-M143 TaxID=3022442 RepID=A0ABT7BYW5_9CYAN|nr:cobaltochelatase subunit CobN [Roseofilum casamattae]MDJ1184265.1 cobaltochelatase subunit CobN [Roseofilum casamattae BLCC-M143]